jgi:Protein of unknown function (DUF1579)
MYEFPKPGAEQESLTKLSGDWKSEVKFYFAPDAPPMVKPGTYRAKLDLGGYFLHREFRVDLDDAGDFKALAFHGYGLTGYDPFQRKPTQGARRSTSPRDPSTLPVMSIRRHRADRIPPASGW